jgi:hypothetical protein
MHSRWQDRVRTRRRAGYGPQQAPGDGLRDPIAAGSDALVQQEDAGLRRALGL